MEVNLRRPYQDISLTFASTNESIWVKRWSCNVLDIAGEPTEKTKIIGNIVLTRPKMLYQKGCL